jgi:hypothetical protein
MTLTDIISKVTRYAKKVIVTDNSSTTAASITQAGTGDSLSITGNAGIGASITTTTGTTLKLQQNNTNPARGGTLEVFPPAGGDFIYNGGTDGIFAFVNTSTASTRRTTFTGANVGIGESNPATALHVGGTITAGRQDTSLEGGEIRLARATDNLTAWHIDAQGSGNTPFLRIFDGQTLTRRVVINGANGNVGVGTTSPQAKLHVNGTVRLQGIPTFADNAAAIAGGLVADDVYKTATGELRIVV